MNLPSLVAAVASLDWPAWVQAVGSVAAIIVAGRTVELTTRRARLERLYGVDGIFLFCATTVREAAKTVQDSLLKPDELQMFPVHRLRDCEAMLANISSMVLEIGSAKLPRITSDASELLRSSIDALNAARMAIGLTNDIAANAILLNANAKKLEDLRTTVLSFVADQKRRVDRWWVPFSL